MSKPKRYEYKLLREEVAKAFSIEIPSKADDASGEEKKETDSEQ